MLRTLTSSDTNEKYVELVNRIQQDDLVAFEEFYNLFYTRVMSFALKFLKSRELAEEIVHDVFMKVWNTRHALDPNLSLNGYIYKITKNLTLNALRTKAEQPKHFQVIKETDAITNKTENEVFAHEMELQLNDAIEGLPTKRKEIFVMSKLDGYSNKEIADKLNISTNTVAGQLRKAKKTLKDTLKFAATI